MAKNNPDFNERLQTAAKAKQAQLAKVRSIAPSNSPEFANRQAERVAVGIAREKRQEAAAARKVIEMQKIADEAAAAALVKAQAAEALEAERLELLNRAANEALALKAKQKEGRDAKYAARQARREGRRASN